MTESVVITISNRTLDADPYMILAWMQPTSHATLLHSPLGLAEPPLQPARTLDLMRSTPQ